MIIPGARSDEVGTPNAAPILCGQPGRRFRLCGFDGSDEPFSVFSPTARQKHQPDEHSGKRRTTGGLEKGALRVCAPLQAVNPDWDTFTGFRDVTKMDGGQPGGRQVTELLS